MSYVFSPSGSKPEVMTWNKTGTTDLTNLPYTIASDSLVDLGSPNWTQVTVDDDHPSMEVTADYGIKFTATGYYAISAGLFLYGTAPISGNSNIISQNLISTVAPDSANAGHWPSPGPTGTESYNRFDISLHTGAVLGLDPDLGCIIKVGESDINKTVYLYVRISGTPGNAMIVRAGDATNKLSTVSVTRMGDLQ